MYIPVVNGFEARLSELIALMPTFSPEVILPGVQPEHVGIGLLSAGLALGFAYLEKRWWPNVKVRWGAWKFARSEYTRKATRTREAMSNRELKLREMIGDIIVDGLLRAGVRGELSLQEERKLYKWLADALKMPDLVPQKSRADDIKKEILSRFHQGYYSMNGVKVEAILMDSKIKRETVTPPPLPVEATVVKREVSTSKYWKPKPVAA